MIGLVYVCEADGNVLIRIVLVVQVLSSGRWRHNGGWSRDQDNLKTNDLHVSQDDVSRVQPSRNILIAVNDAKFNNFIPQIIIHTQPNPLLIFLIEELKTHQPETIRVEMNI